MTAEEGLYASAKPIQSPSKHTGNIKNTKRHFKQFKQDFINRHKNLDQRIKSNTNCPNDKAQKITIKM